MPPPLPTEEELDHASQEILRRVLEREVGQVTMSFAVFEDDIKRGEGLVAQVKRGALVQNMVKAGTDERMAAHTNFSRALRDHLAVHGAHLFQDFFLSIGEFTSGRFLYNFEEIPFSCRLERWEEGTIPANGRYHLVDHRPF